MFRQKDYQTMMLEPGGVEEATVVHVTDPDNFYIQLARNADSLEEVMAALTVRMKLLNHKYYRSKDKVMFGNIRSWQFAEATF